MIGRLFQDGRLAGGYENVPTVDIHTSQIGWEKHWLYFLKEYILPYTSKVFIGHSAEVNKTEASVETAAAFIILLRFLPSRGDVSVAVGFPFPCSCSSLNGIQTHNLDVPSTGILPSPFSCHICILFLVTRSYHFSFSL